MTSVDVTTRRPRGSVSVTKVVKNTVIADDGRLNAVESGGFQYYYVHTQAIPATEWVVNHNLTFTPSVTVVNNSEEVLIGEVQFTGEQQITVRFTAPFSGKVYLS
jgi:hypothetical protein